MAISSAVVTVLFIGVGMRAMYGAADRRGIGVRTVILGTDDELAVFDGPDDVTRFRWSAVATGRVSEQWFEVVTDQPDVICSVPTWAFAEGERERSIRAFERSRAERG